MLQDQDDGGRAVLGSVLGLRSDDQVERCLDVLARLSAYHPQTALTAAAVVAGGHVNLTLRAERQSHATPGRPGRTALAGAYQRLLSPWFCDLIAQRLADDEPGNTTYRRDLSVSFNKLADLAREAGQSGEAHPWVSRAFDIRRRLVRDESGRLDLAVELAYVLYLWTEIDAPADADVGPAHETVRLLEPFERLGYLTPRALARLEWARRPT